MNYYMRLINKETYSTYFVITVIVPERPTKPGVQSQGCPAQQRTAEDKANLPQPATSGCLLVVIKSGSRPVCVCVCQACVLPARRWGSKSESFEQRQHFTHRGARVQLQPLTFESCHFPLDIQRRREKKDSDTKQRAKLYWIGSLWG